MQPLARFISSLARENKPRCSSSLNKDAARLPHGVWKANLVQTVGQAAEWGLSVSFQLSWKLPPVTHQELHLCVFTEHRKSAHLCQVQLPLTHQSKLPFSICASAYPIMIYLCATNELILRLFFFSPRVQLLTFCSAPTFACVYPSGTLHCINQGFSAPPVVTASAPTTWRGGGQKDKGREREIILKFSSALSTVCGNAR